jgi:hypothetical protein
MKRWTVEESGGRYRYRCECGHAGRWYVNPNDADGDGHLYRAHGLGE